MNAAFLQGAGLGDRGVVERSGLGDKVQRALVALHAQRCEPAISAASSSAGSERVVRDALHESDLARFVDRDRAPVSRMSRAAPWPTSTASRRMFGALSSTPSFAAGMPIFAVGATTRRSHATASCIPAPSAAPFTAAMTGAGMVDDRVEHPLERGPERVAAAVLQPAGVLRPAG